MPVNTKHPEYKEYEVLWERCEDVVEGQDEIQKKGVKYLPKLGGQTADQYVKYLGRAVFYNATGRTVDAMTGMLFLKPPVVEAPIGFEDIMKNVNFAGSTIYNFAEELAEEVIVIGRAGVLVDYPPAVDVVTVGQAQSMGLRPYAKIYEAESIINWKTALVNNAEEVVMVVLEEEYEVYKDEFEYKCETEWRVLDLTVDGYRQRVFRRIPNTEDFEVVSEVYPLMNGQPMQHIPFVFFGVKNGQPCCEEPPLLDLVNVNISHYKTTADYEHGLHFTALPTAVVTGWRGTEDGASLSIGSGDAWLIGNEQAKVQYLEFTGQGLGALEKALLSKEMMMATLGSRMLTTEKRAVETAETAAIHRAGENSVLSSISKSISTSLTQVMQIMSDWAGLNGTVTVRLNNDFLPAALTADQLNALVRAWQSGAISFDTLYENLVNGEIIRPDLTAADEKERIQSNTDMLNIAMMQKAMGNPALPKNQYTQGNGQGAA